MHINCMHVHVNVLNFYLNIAWILSMDLFDISTIATVLNNEAIKQEFMYCGAKPLSIAMQYHFRKVNWLGTKLCNANYMYFFNCL